MPMIFIESAKSEEILGHISFKDIISNNHRRSLIDNLETFSFETFADRGYSSYLSKRNMIIIPGEDGELREFIILETEVNRITNRVQVFSSASYLTLKTAKIISPHKTSAESAEKHAKLALSGTEWQPGNITFNGIKDIEFDKYINPLLYLKRIAKEFELELNFRIDRDENAVIGRYVDMVEQVGNFNGRVVKFSNDLLELNRIEKSDKIVTALYGLGPKKEDGTQLKVFVEDKDALDRWGRNGQHIVEVFEPQNTDKNIDKNQLMDLTEEELKKRINSSVEYIGGIKDLEEIAGMKNKIIRFGDTIFIKDTHFEPPLYLQSRIYQLDRDIVNKSNKQVELGDYIEYSEEEISNSWKDLKAEIRNKLSFHQLYEYTYNKLQIEEKDEAIKTDVKEYANTVSNKTKDELYKYTNNTMDPIIVNVENIENELRNVGDTLSKAQTDITQAYNELSFKATKIELDTINDRINSAESEISTIAGEVELKAESESVTELETRLNQAEINIDGINSELIFKANSTVVESLEERITNSESQLSIQAGKIASKVSQEDYNGEHIASLINQSASEIAIEAEKVNFKGQINFSDLDSTTQSEINDKATQSSVDSINNKINNAVTTIDNSGVTVKDGNFKLRDTNSNIESIIRENTNLIYDHSFELVKLDSLIESIGNWGNVFSVDQSAIVGKVRQWTNTNPSTAMIVQSQSNSVTTLFGQQSAVLRGLTYGIWDYYFEPSAQFQQTKALSFSSFVAPYEHTTFDVTVSLRLQAVSSEGYWIKDLATTSYTINHNNKYNWQRVCVSFKGELPEETGQIRARLFLNNDTNSAKCLCDGVQVVPYDYPAIYFPETQTFSMMTGTTKAKHLNTGDLSVANNAYFSGKAVFLESIDKELHAFLSLRNGWRNYSGSYQNARVSKSADGWVHLSGLIKDGLVGEYTLAILPVGCRPNKVEVFTTGDASIQSNLVYIYPNGDIGILRGNNGFVSLSGISFLGEK